jgi:hypothetical protein
MYYLLWRLLEDLSAGNSLSPFLGLSISALLTNVVVAYTNDGYLRDALQMNHRSLRKPNCSNSGYPAFGCYGSVKMIRFSYSNKDTKDEEGS